MKYLTPVTLKWLHVMEAYWKKSDDMPDLLQVLHYYQQALPMPWWGFYVEPR
jgi:hypothetical protein